MKSAPGHVMSLDFDPQTLREIAAEMAKRAEWLIDYARHSSDIVDAHAYNVDAAAFKSVATNLRNIAGPVG